MQRVVGIITDKGNPYINLHGKTYLKIIRRGCTLSVIIPTVIIDHNQPKINTWY